MCDLEIIQDPLCCVAPGVSCVCTSVRCSTRRDLPADPRAPSMAVIGSTDESTLMYRIRPMFLGACLFIVVPVSICPVPAFSWDIAGRALSRAVKSGTKPRSAAESRMEDFDSQSGRRTRRPLVFSG